ncbi:uncharacterized protein [Atheta coriaria]|uniref:uncharacterized protein isoform X2 n=1 Tax=Dalotia coriaria TaxID=877792 RepID=UPI0031F35DD6
MTSTSSTTTVRKSYGNRKISTCAEDYYRLVKKNNAPTVGGGNTRKSEEIAKLIKYIDENIVGKNSAFLGPFGRRKVVFCDYVASGRSLQFIEEYIQREVLPCHGNTHSTTNITSLQSTLFRQEARDIIKNAVNASDDDAVIFVGHGCAGAIKKLVNALDLDAPTVFVGASEHQDNLQIWQEIGAQIIRIAETKQNHLDLNDLEEQLKLHRNSGRQLVGCFAATSSVTGILVDDVAATMLLHQYGAFAFWDYNLAAPYLTMNMNPKVPGVEDTSLVLKDAIYFSGHKFIGGVQTPGILVAKKSLFKRVNTFEPEGFFALHEQNRSFELQEEGTSAAIIESIRAGLVMQLKESVTVANIVARQDKITKQMLQHIRTIPEIILLGNSSTGLKRIPVFSFMVRHPRGTFLHHNFVCAILNDVFGIQARGGCPCSGAYAQDLLGIDQSLATQYENIILEDQRLGRLNLSMEKSHLELLRPGFTRISLPYFINDNELAFIMEAVKMVATEGWKLLPQYTVDGGTGEWRHHTNPISRDRKWLGSIRYVDGKMTMNERRISGPGLFPQSYPECLQTARNLFNRARKIAMRSSSDEQGIKFDTRAEKLRWFMLQHEAQDILTGNSQNIKHDVPFNPQGFSGSKRTEKENEKITSNSIPHPVSNTSSPRHFSLPAIDDHRILTSSSPVPYFVQDMNSFYFPTSYTTQGPVNFAVGECVSTQVLNPVPQSPHPGMFSRERCFSLGGPISTQAQPILSPQTKMSLGLRQRNCSCSSAQDFQSLDSDAQMSPTHSMNSMNVLGSFDLGRTSPSDLQTYVTEMTKELATNIKSEIREVINKVEDALDGSDYTKHGGFNSGGSGSDDGRSDSISAVEVAEYIEKVSKEMANEVKSEFRDAFNAVDVYITPDKRSFSRASSSGDSEKGANSAISTTSAKEDRYTPGSSSETVIQMINKSNSTNGLNDDDHVLMKKMMPCYMHTNLSSQDSGINLSFQEHEGQEYTRRPSSTESRSERARNMKLHLKIHSESEDKPEEINSEEVSSCKWSCPPKNIWEGTIEAIDEFEMIRNGDRVMVCLSGGKDSLSLLHTLLQYQSVVLTKGVEFSIGAVTIDSDEPGCDPCVLVQHLKSLGVHYVLDGHNETSEDDNTQTEEAFYSFATRELRHRLYSTAKSGEYNVLAIGQHLDDLVENFILNLFHTGKLQTLKAHYYIKEHDLRVIRPFVYLRDKVLRNFVTHQNLPAILNSYVCPDISKDRQRARQLLAQQELYVPKLFASIRQALHPLISFQEENAETLARLLHLKAKDDSEPETDEEPVFLQC